MQASAITAIEASPKKRRPSRTKEAERSHLLAEIDADLAKVCPDYPELTKTLRHFAGRYLSAEKPQQAVLGVISPRSGEGRTTMALGLAGALAEMYSRVV